MAGAVALVAGELVGFLGKIVRWACVGGGVVSCAAWVEAGDVVLQWVVLGF